MLARGEPEKGRTALYQHEIGELTESRAGDEGAAVKAYAKALQSDATLKPNLWAIRRVFERRALWPNLQKLLDAEIRFAKTPEEKAELYVEKGELLEDRLNDPARALDCFNRAIEASPASLPAWMALEKIHTRARDLGQLARVWRGMADATGEPARKVALLLDLARLQESIGGGPDAGAGAVARGARRRRRRRIACSTSSSGLPTRAAIKRGAAGGARRARAAADGRSSAELPIARAACNESERLVALRRRQARWRASAATAKARGATCRRRCAAAPGEPLIVRELSELAESLGRWDELADLLAARVEVGAGGAQDRAPAERAEALRRAGKAAEADAVESEVARDEPGHLGLLIARERTALAARDWEKLAALWTAEAELANSDGTPTGKRDPEWAATAFVQAAAAYDHLGREAEAHKALDDARKLVPASCRRSTRSSGSTRAAASTPSTRRWPKTELATNPAPAARRAAARDR